MVTPEPILDIVRALSTVASAGIIFNQLRTVWSEIFTGTCDYCRGSGKVICQKCRGTKSMRQRQAQYNRSEGALMDNAGDYTPCVFCGPPTKYDFDSKAQDDEGEAIMVHENLKAALAGKLRPNPFKPFAGTVPCPQCNGSPVVKRHTPNFERFFAFELPWDFQVAQRVGYLRIGGDVAGAERPSTARFRLLEYPSKPPPLPEGRKAEPSPKVSGSTDAGGFAMSAKDQFRLEDYVLTYIDDEED